MKEERHNRLFLVSCVAGKQRHPSPAADLYTSTWFKKARKLIEATGSPWFILSAEYGLLPPDRVIAPYEKTLNKMSKPDRNDWAKMVARQMDDLLPNCPEAIILAGAKYREPLRNDLNRRFQIIRIPMEGLPIGLQLRWMTNVKAL